MPKYRVYFTFTEKSNVDVLADSEAEAVKLFPNKLLGFNNIEFVAAELISERCAKTADMFATK